MDLAACARAGGAYYNEHDEKAAAWLRELIKAGHIAPGIVDERSIEDVLPNELAGFTQCHFFAGIGVWSYALRRAGWPDNRPVWTGSCPCQPFSAAGKGDGFADERHLWPAWFHLISQCRPDVVFGEQVASKDADTWIDLVHTDMEALGYAFGAVPFPSAGVGAPHIRDRLYWVADATGQRRQHEPTLSGSNCAMVGEARSRIGVGSDNDTGGMANASRERRDEGRNWNNSGDDRAILDADGADGGLGNTLIPGLEGQSRDGNRSDEPGRIGTEQGGPVAETSAIVRPGPTNGFWRDADWLGCRDGKWRPVRPGTFPLAHGAPARVGRLRGYGNAINAEAATAFIEAWMMK
jgi:DNA (cytosine-5)-methyltransferase 1